MSLCQNWRRRRGDDRGVTTDDAMTYVYKVAGPIAYAQPCASGPWDPDMQHGGAPASLIAWAIERMPTRDPMQVVRMTFDLLRPIPVAPLEIKIDIQREGRKIQVCNVTLSQMPT